MHAMLWAQHQNIVKPKFEHPETGVPSVEHVGLGIKYVMHATNSAPDEQRRQSPSEVGARGIDKYLSSEFQWAFEDVWLSAIILSTEFWNKSQSDTV